MEMLIIKSPDITKENKMPNNLINEKSPYLLQHAYNPVNWYPWSKEAFEKAKTEDKPVFLSIGYSTCHWCHVMERESFEDDEVSRLLNNGFISIKVDREERPDVDSVYMSVCQSLNGQGGWPLTIIMTPDKKPFYAATYIPKENRYKMTGLVDLLPEILALWHDSRPKILETGESIVDILNKNAGTSVSGEPDTDLLHNAYKLFNRSFDKHFGGFGNAPKFPTPHNLLFLLRYAEIESNPYAKEMAENTLISMFRGGIYDHIGGGFSRYSTDEKWLIPHFEKMLYDNALLIITYLNAYVYTGKKLFASIVKKTIGYVISELADKSGGFYCGQDADSEGVEGKYYIFTPDEIINILGSDNGKLFCKWFDITEKGNFENQNVINLLANDEFEKENPIIEQCCRELYSYRLKRTVLHKDDKILTSWNALIIIAMAKAYTILEEKRYLTSALNTESFISENLCKNNRLMVLYRQDDSAGEGTLDDYAFYTWALLELYNATFDLAYLVKTLRYVKVMCEQFFDFENGGFYLNANDAEQLIIRPKEIYDGAVPSGNSVAAYALSKVAKLTGESQWQDYSSKQIKYIAGNINDYPAGYSFSLLAIIDTIYPSYDLICLSPSQSDLEKLRKLIIKYPNLNILVKTQDNNDNISVIAPYTQKYEFPLQGSQFYLCFNNTCSAPVNNIDELKF